MAKVYDILEKSQGRQNLCATQQDCRSQVRQMTAVGFISDTEEIVKSFWLNFQHDGVAALKLLEWLRFP